MNKGGCRRNEILASGSTPEHVYEDHAKAKLHGMTRSSRDSERMIVSDGLSAIQNVLARFDPERTAQSKQSARIAAPAPKERSVTLR